MTRITKSMIRESHRRQFNDEDYQQVAWEIGNALPFTPTDDEWQELMSSPDDKCKCGFCETAPWE